MNACRHARATVRMGWAHEANLREARIVRIVDGFDPNSPWSPSPKGV